MAFGIFFTNQVSASSNTLNFQSKIVNVADGTNVVSGTPSCVVAGSGNDTCDFRVRIYDASSAGTLLFSETHSNIEIGQYNGIFNLSINSVCASTSTAGTDGNWTSGGCITNGGVDFSAASLWIEVGFDPAGGASFTETFSRVQIKDVASARYAVSASYLGGIAAADFVQFKPGATQTTSSTNSLINLETTGNSSNPLIYADEDGAGTPDLLRLQTNDVTMFQVGNGGAVTMAGDLINTSTGTIGLFNTNVTILNIGGAATTLNLAGGSGSTGCTINSTGDLACSGSISGGVPSFVQGGNSFSALAVLGTNDVNALAFETSGVERMRIGSDGQIGIGTTSIADAQFRIQTGVLSPGVTMSASSSSTTFTTSGSITLYVGDFIVPSSGGAQAREVTVGGTGTSFTVGSAFTTNLSAVSFTISRKSQITGPRPTLSLNKDMSPYSAQEWLLRVGGDAPGSDAFELRSATTGVTALYAANDGDVMLGTNFNYGGIGNTSRLYVYGGTSGANIDVMGNGAVVDQATIELQSSDYETTASSAYFQYYGVNGVGTTLGFTNTYLGALVFQESSVGIVATNSAAPLVFGTDNVDRGRFEATGNFLTTADISINGGDLLTNQTTFNLINTTATTLNIGGAATTLNLAGGVGSTGCTINSAGDLSCTGTIAATITADSLDYDDFEDTMDLDAALTLNQSTNTWVQNFTGTTTNGFTYNVNSLTSGSGQILSSSSVALTGNLQTISLTGDNAANTGDLLEISITGTTSATRGLYIDNRGTGDSLRIEDVASDTTPFVLDASGNLSVGGNINTSLTSIDLLNTTATTINIGGAATTLNVGISGASGTLALMGGSGATGCTVDGTTGGLTCTSSGTFGTSLISTTTSFDLVNTTATTINFGGAVTTLNMAGGSGSTGCTINGTGDLACSGDLTATGGDLFTTAATSSIFNTGTPTSVSIAGGATTTNLGGGTVNLAGGSASTGCTIDTNGNIACTGSGTFGTTSSPQLRVQYDVSNYFTSAVASDGTVTFDSSSAGLYDVFSFSDSVEIDKDFSTSDPIALRVVSTSASTSSGGSLGSVLLRTTKTASSASGNIVGLYSEANFNNTTSGTFDSVTGVSSRPTGGFGIVGANSSVTTLVGFESNPYWNSSGTVTNVIGLRANPQGTTNGTRTNEYGVYVGNIVNATNTYGVYVEGASTYAIWSDAGQNRFDGNLVTGSTSLDVFNTTATTLNIGGAATTLNVGISGASGTLALMGGSGVTGCTIDGTTGSLTCSGSISGTGDTLDYDDFDDTMDLDADLILNQGAFTWVQNFTGTITIGQTYNATSLTTGTGLRMVAGAGLLATGELLDLDLGASTAGNALNINTNAANYAGTGLINITSASSTAGTGILLTMTGSTTGAALSITNTAAYTGTVGLARISTTGITSGTALGITTGNALTTNGELIDLNMGASTAGNGLNVTTTGAYIGTGLVVLTANTAQTGTVQSIFANALTAGTALNISSTSAALTGNLQTISLSGNNAANTGDLLELIITGGSNVARGLFINNAGIGASMDVSQTSTPGATNVNSVGITSSILGTSSGTHRTLNVLGIGAPTVGLTQTGVFGGTIQGANNGAGTITTGYALTTMYSNNSTGTVSGAYGVFAQVANTSTGTITGAIGVQIGSAVNNGGGTFTTNYGMRIDSQTAGATDYGLYITGADTYSLVVASGDTYLGTGLVTHAFAGTTTIGYSMTANSITSGSALQISTSTTSASSWNLVNLSSSGANASGRLINLTVTDSSSLAVPLRISNVGTSPSISVENGSYNIFSVNAANVNIGSSSLDQRLSVMRDYGGVQAFTTSIFHDGNNANADVLLLQGGLDDGTGTTIYLQARDGDGTNVGRIVNAAGTFSLADQSDRRTKTNIINTSIEGLSVLNALRVVDYNRIADPNGPTIHGFIAQEVQEVYPFAVIEPDDQGMLSLSKELMIPMIVKATQELSEKVDSNYQELSPLSTLRIDVDALNLRLNNTIGILDAQKLRIDALESTVAGLQNTISNFQGYTLPSTASFTELVLTGVLKIEGQLLLSNKNIGTSTVTAGQTEVSVTFATAFPQTPVVVASPIDSFVGYTVKEITQTGFKIAIESPAAQDIQFNWFVSSNLP